MRRDEALLAQVYGAVLQGHTTVDAVMVALNMPMMSLGTSGQPALDMNRQRVIYCLDILESEGNIAWPRSPNGERIAGGIRLPS